MPFDRELVFATVADHRRLIANTLEDLDDDRLATPSLCAGWDVETVGAHVLSTVADGLPVFLASAVRRGSLARAIDELACRRAQSTTAEIVSGLRAVADRRISPPLFGPLDPLADVLVHYGDIAIPLGLPFEPDPHSAASALDFLTGPWPFGFVPLGLLRGIRLRGLDIGRTWGNGAEVRGPVAALMMTVCGRTALLDDLDGPGLPLLRRRLRI
ncbi:maleylpyruvate isomerase family mycothiol-dependent enzyme [Nocardia sp. BMG111209]|uniref:maleylpyruvate isomerase family mycothiol-dependent enzyme n=1 Tax=Nocardia sp. BMG111209 TaxID=1160137 RepID=UPI00037A7B51|nr:maleylpyruvate isomerase family mycothiol-dependent enzyme [Nocardia sp. BMG111209]